MYTSTIKKTTQTQARIIAHPASFIQMAIQQKPSTRLALPTSEGVRFVRIEDVVRCKSDGNYCSVFIENGETVLLSKTLKWVLERLPSAEFLRTHASHVVSMSRIAMLTPEEVQLEGGECVPISRQRRDEVKSRLLDE